MKFKMRGGAVIKTRDSGSRRSRTRDVAEKTLVAVYKGQFYIAERNGEDLNIFAIGDNGVPGVRNSTGDRQARDAFKAIRDNAAPIKATNEANADFWKDKNGHGGNH